MSEKRRVLIVDDESVMTGFLGDLLSRHFEVDRASSASDAIQYLESSKYSIVLTDMQMEKVDSGLQVIECSRKLQPEASVVLMTAYGTVENAVQAMKLGACEILIKPFGPGELLSLLESLLKEEEESGKVILPKEKKAKKKIRRPMVGESHSLMKIFDVVECVAATNATVLITGESGTGKELVASLLHDLSRRNGGPFIRINCAAITETLLESTLFGHEKGAFTGAVKRTPGKFELANGGTLLLDEISEMKPEMQSKLLRVLQEREFERVGGTTTIPVDVRIIATSNRNLKEEVREGSFREDLFFRLNVVPVHMPPLRAREGDVSLLLNHFVQDFMEENQLPEPSFEPGLLEKLNSLSWPGNVRQFQNAVERALVLSQGKTIQLSDFLLDHDVCEHTGKGNPLEEDITIKEMERRMIMAALERFDDNRTQAAQHLGISVRTLRNKLNLYSLEPEALGV
ncbi:MAG: sigma-54 dependent transcriptional regulator [Candidatus Krumholzibacteria bacterium]|nr:sigma-54 dependent transcriptional regulator [Candidatus Krumholzibacteria bacterium]MDP6796300.1 sigma-54 dependent transcriptional regulator [Candidatus Krumholzibacteria bacterium]MDP7020961.1 sigma-54 dependent transcriptional regulator [Candidatus Krumholzibacteria bacterium]